MFKWLDKIFPDKFSGTMSVDGSVGDDTITPVDVALWGAAEGSYAKVWQNHKHEYYRFSWEAALSLHIGLNDEIAASLRELRKAIDNLKEVLGENASKRT